MLQLIIDLLLAVSAVLTSVLAVRLARSIRRFQPPDGYSLPDDAPSVSICIPARNEVHAMTRCLERVLASDYEKLEVVVFDDSSSDNTSIVIRSFAQAGVRFVEGTGVPEGWLGKNYALDVLAREASGTYVAFVDVDTAIGPKTIGRLVAYLGQENAAMVSVIPERADGWRLSVFFGYLRYFWELAARGGQTPAAASALWMIDRHKLLNDLGGLSPLKSTAAPESAVAASLTSIACRCLISNQNLGVTYEKKWTSQIESARRLLYPKVGGTWVEVMGAVMGLALLNLPFVALLMSLLFGWRDVPVMAGLVLVLGMATYGIYTKRMWRHVWWAGVFLWPLVVMQELLLLTSSIIGYQRHTITWKGRPVSPLPLPRRVES